MVPAQTGVRTTREDYVRMVETGAFAGRRAELVDGVVYEMAPQLSPHASGIRRSLRALQAVFSPGDYDVDVQLPLDLGESDVPEPDLAVVPRDPTDYREAHPTGAVLVLEVADSSLHHDRKKARSYAAAGIEDYWIANLIGDVLEVYREPVGNSYRIKRIFRRGERIAPLAKPGASIAVDDLLPVPETL